MANIKLTLQYDGTRYLGWTRPEKDGYNKTVSYRLSSVLEKMTGSPVTLHAGAKTEPGVHALEQTVSFVTEAFSDIEMLHQDLDHYLPMDIRILHCEAVPERFRADLNARSRTYEYRICTAPVYNIFVKISNVPLRALIVNCILFLVDIYPIPKYTCLRYDKHFI